MKIEDLNPEQLHILKHSWGYDCREPGFRNHYCGDLDNKDILRLNQLGLMTGPKGIGLVGEGCGLFYLTDEAIKFLEELKKGSKKMEVEIQKEVDDATECLIKHNRELLKDIDRLSKSYNFDQAEIARLNAEVNLLTTMLVNIVKTQSVPDFEFNVQRARSHFFTKFSEEK